jgi:hypothetical protein
MTLSAFGRYPTESEKTEFAKALADVRLAKGTTEQQKETRRQALEDMVWAMLTSKEFIFNH